MTRKPGAPDHNVRGVAHDYWIEKRKIRLEKQAASSKGKIIFDNMSFVWDKMI